MLLLLLKDFLLDRSDDATDGIDEDANHIEVVIRLALNCLLIDLYTSKACYQAAKSFGYNLVCRYLWILT